MASISVQDDAWLSARAAKYHRCAGAGRHRHRKHVAPSPPCQPDFRIP